MSRSRKKAIIKGRPRNSKKSTNYWKPIRRITKQIVDGFLEDYREIISENFDLSNRAEGLEQKIPSPKELKNDYDHCDYIIDYEFQLNDIKEKNKNRRK